PGGSLGDRVTSRGPLSLLDATRAMIDACKGVGAAHAAGLVHRDIKPANFMVAADGTVKVADFGLAKAASDTGKHLTQTGQAVGTPFFMSPEQCEARPVDHRTDLYSLGATYYSLLTGKFPFHQSGSVPQVMYQHCHGPIPDPRADNSAVPEACARIIARSMAKAPADRYQSADQMLADLQTVAATLSGQTTIALPSESGTVRAMPASGTMPMFSSGFGPPVPPQSRGHGTRYLMAGVAGVAVIGLGLLAFRPWAASREGPPPNAVAAPAGEPIKVGVLHSLSGTMATSSSAVVDAT